MAGEYSTQDGVLRQTKTHRLQAIPLLTASRAFDVMRVPTVIRSPIIFSRTPHELSKNSFHQGAVRRIRARGGMSKLPGERTGDVRAREALPGPTRSCVWHVRAGTCCLRPSGVPAFDWLTNLPEGRQEPWLTAPALAALAALAASGCCVSPCGSGALIARMLDKQRGEQPSVGTREKMARSSTRPFRYCRSCTALHCAGRPGFQRVCPCR
jgi:hypothetical protein